MSTLIDSYTKELKHCIKLLKLDSIRQITYAMYIAHRNDCNIYIVGNGGSATTALHFATDLSKLHIKANTLIDNIGLITAWANDEDYTVVFKEQLFALKPNDIVIFLSVSGNSPNILTAAGYASLKRATIISFTGSQENCLSKLCNIHIATPSTNYGIVEDTHLMMCHMIAQMLGEKLCKA